MPWQSLHAGAYPRSIDEDSHSNVPWRLGFPPCSTARPRDREPESLSCRYAASVVLATGVQWSIQDSTKTLGPERPYQSEHRERGEAIRLTFLEDPDRYRTPSPQLLFPEGWESDRES